MTKSIYRSPAGGAAVTGAYDVWLQRSPVAVESLRVPTRFGTAHVLTGGQAAADGRDTPVIALAGTNFPALAWSPLLPLRTCDFRFFGVDLIGQPGRSQGNRLKPSSEDSLRWLEDVMDGLEIPTAHFIGHSLGAHLALRFAAARPRRVARLALTCPGGLMRLRVPAAVLARTLAWLARPGPATSRALLCVMSEPDRDVEDLVPWMTVVGRHVRTSLAPGPLPPTVLSAVISPVLLVAGGRDPFLPGDRLAEVAQRRLLGCRTIVIPDGSHLLPHDRPRQIRELLAEFLGDG